MAKRDMRLRIHHLSSSPQKFPSKPPPNPKITENSVVSARKGGGKRVIYAALPDMWDTKKHSKKRMAGLVPYDKEGSNSKTQ